MELKRFYNNYTDSVLRVNPLFQRINNISKKKEIIGMCWDTDVLDDYWDLGGLKKGSMVILKEPSKRINKTYKGEPLFDLKEDIVNWFQFINDNHINHKNRSYRRYGWENYCD
tara:strand:- start:83 stop:421 length:339 start_codon:yes stop_codon:yes gene_type:complete